MNALTYLLTALCERKVSRFRFASDDIDLYTVSQKK